jgi:hypothetical protein
LRSVEGAFSIVMMTRDRIFAARDPRGFRPLSMGRIKNLDGPDTIVFASETCAFDLLRADYTSAMSSPANWSWSLKTALPAASTPPGFRKPVASSNTFTSPALTAASTAAGCRKAATRWAAS